MSAGCDDLRMSGENPGEAFSDKRVVTLVRAIGREDVPAIDDAVKAGANINAVGHHNTTPLHWALTKPGMSVATLKRLLELGANPNAKDEQGNSPVSLTAGGSRPELLELFLQYGGDSNIRKNSITSALQEAVSAHSEENIRTLLKYGANVNARNTGLPNGDTACLDAASTGRFDFIVLFLENGLTEDLDRCARYLTNTVMAEDSPQNAWREKALKLLRAKGVDLDTLQARHDAEIMAREEKDRQKYLKEHPGE